MREFKNVKIGDTVRVQFKIMEEDAERIQNFEGTLIRIRGSGPSQTLTVRKISFGVGVERIYPTASPRFLAVTKVRGGSVRRSKLYYMRELTGKSHRVAYEGSSVPNSKDKHPAPAPKSPAPAAPKAEIQAVPAPAS